MAKINITEGELKRIIKESVISEITEAQKDRFNRRYNAYNTAVQNYNNNYAKNWGELNGDEIAKRTNEYNAYKNTLTGEDDVDQYGSAEAYYNSNRKAAQNNVNYALNRRGMGAKMKEQLDNVNRQLNGIRNALGAGEQEEYQGIVQRIYGLNKKAKDLEAANTALNALYGTLKAKDQATALKNAESYRRAAGKWYAYQKQQQQTPQGQKPQTMMAESEDEGIGDTVRTAAQKVKNTMGKAKQTAKNALKNWQGKRDAHDKMMAQQNQARTALANNQINRF